MKYFIAFTLFFLTNCLVPTAISAATNPTNVTTHSVVLPAKKLNFWQKLEEAKPKNNLIIFGIVLILIGVLIVSVGRNEPIPQRQWLDLNPFSSRGTIIFIGTAFVITGVGMILWRIAKFLFKWLFG